MSEYELLTCCVDLLCSVGYVLSYPNGNIAVDLFLLIVMAVLEGLRLYWGECVCVCVCVCVYVCVLHLHLVI